MCLLLSVTIKHLRARTTCEWTEQALALLRQQALISLRHHLGSECEECKVFEHVQHLFELEAYQ